MTEGSKGEDDEIEEEEETEMTNEEKEVLQFTERYFKHFIAIVNDQHGVFQIGGPSGASEGVKPYF